MYSVPLDHKVQLRKGTTSDGKPDRRQDNIICITEFIFEMWQQVFPTEVKRNKNSVHLLLQFEQLLEVLLLSGCLFIQKFTIIKLDSPSVWMAILNACGKKNHEL